MAEKTTTAPAIDFTGLDNYSMKESDGWPDLWPANGIFSGIVKKATAGVSKSGNGTFKLIVIGDEEGTQGLQLTKDVPYTGLDKNGEPNVRQLADVMVSSGVDEDTVRKDLAKKKGVPPEKLAEKYLISKRVFFRIEKTAADDKNGNEHVYSEIVGFVKKAKYDEGAAANTNRKPYGDAARSGGKAAAGKAEGGKVKDDLDSDDSAETAEPAKAEKPAKGGKAADPMDDI